MKLKVLIFTTVLALATVARGATNDLTELLQKGLFEEEANRDLTAAIVNYQSLASAFDKDRQLAATAVFRLGECYRKLGKTDDAIAQYQRILKEFSDQQTLVTLSRQNLVGLGGAAAVGVAPSNPTVSEQARQLEWVKKLQAMSPSEVRQVAPTVLTDATLINLIYQYNQTELDLIRLRTDHGEEHSEVQKEKAIQSALQDKIKERLDGLARALAMETGDSGTASGANGTLLSLQIKRMQESIADDRKQLEELLKRYLPENSQVVALKEKIDAENLKLAELTGTLQSSQGASTESTPLITDDEQQEIRRIQVMIQNSPDLINADGGGMSPLTRAASQGQLVVAKYLLDHGANVNGSGKSGTYGEVPLTAATESGQKAMVELLLARGADVNGGGRSPLYDAVQKGYTAVVEVLLAHHADVNLPTGTYSGGLRPIQVAARDGRTEMVKLLIEHGADLNVADVGGQTALDFAAMGDVTNSAKLLLAAKASVDAKDKAGDTALHVAAERGFADMVSLLLDAGATVNSTNNNAVTPLCAAINSDHTDAVRMLLEHKADPNRSGNFRDNNGNFMGWAPVFLAIDKGNNEVLRLLLDAGGNADTGNPIFAAIDKNNAGAVQLLLDHGANPNVARKNLSALSAAIIYRRDKQIISALLDKGADPNAKDSDGWFPLFRAQDPEVGQLLIDHKADVNIRLAGGDTPLMESNNTNITELLAQSGAKVDAQNIDGNTALHIATAIRQLPEMVAILLKYKANPNIQNEAGETPLDLAQAGFEGKIPMGLYSLKSAPLNTVGAKEKEISELLINAGGLANLPKRNRIEVRRASTAGVAFTKGSRDWNRYTLLEMIAGEYHLLTQNTIGDWTENRNGRWNLWVNDLRFPDFKNVIIYRRTDASAKQKAITVNVEDILGSGDCSRDMWLEWGDVLEIPETDHPVDLTWPGLSDQTLKALTNCLARQVTIIVKGVNTTMKLMPEFKNENGGDMLQVTHVSFMLRSVLDNSKLVRVSSDLSRVKVTRIDPDTKKKQEWIVDCTNSGLSDLWLRDGDVIDVPEK